jgi:hypothetical protein
MSSFPDLILINSILDGPPEAPKATIYSFGEILRSVIHC